RNVRLALEQRREMPDTDLDVDSGIVEKGRIPRLDAGGWGDRLPHRRHHLHQAPRSGRRSRARIEIRFLTDEASYERGVQTSAARLRDDSVPRCDRIYQAPDVRCRSYSRECVAAEGNRASGLVRARERRG